MAKAPQPTGPTNPKPCTDPRDPKEKAAVVIGAGAPHSSLMAGALCAIWEGGRTFDIIYTAGAGGLMGGGG